MSLVIGHEKGKAFIRTAIRRSNDFRAELPRTPTGKLLKRILREQYWPRKG